MIEVKTQLNVPKDSKLLHSIVRPNNYHCTCEYCSGQFMGDIYDTENNLYYSNMARKKYLPKYENSSMVHNNPGHFPGYRWAIQNLTDPGDLVFDPTVGTGTAIFEAENNGRRGIGVELEFPDTTRFMTEGRGTVIEGNTLTVKPDDFLELDSISLLINGTPYPVLSGKKSSDTYLVMGEDRKDTYYGDYRNSDNIGKWKEKEYRLRVHEIYTKYVPYMKSGSYLVIIIKDPIQNKEPYNLHKVITDSILENNSNIKYYGYFIHRHVPLTMFMRTYRKRFDIIPPLYQTGIVMRKD